MKIVVNGEERQVEASLSVRGLLDALGLKEEGIAVAVDRQVIPKGDHARHVLTEGAQVEVIRAVGGG